MTNNSDNNSSKSINLYDAELDVSYEVTLNAEDAIKSTHGKLILNVLF